MAKLHVRRHVIAEHVAALLGSFPVAPHSPEVFVRRMIEEIVVLDPWASDIERGCRRLIRKSGFPDIATLIKAIQEGDGLTPSSTTRSNATKNWRIPDRCHLSRAWRSVDNAKLAIREPAELKKPIRINTISIQAWRSRLASTIWHWRSYRDAGVAICGQVRSGLKNVIDRFLEPYRRGAGRKQLTPAARHRPRVGGADRLGTRVPHPRNGSAPAGACRAGFGAA